MLKFLFARFYANKIIQKDLGPLSTSFLRSFQKGICQKCGSKINDCSLLGNSLVTFQNEVKLICCRCRTGQTIHIPKYSFDRFNRNRIIIAFNDFSKDNKIQYRWISILLALRTGYTNFQSGIHKNLFKVKLNNSPKDNFMLKEDILYRAYDYTPPISDEYGEIENVGNCGECGAFWSNQFSNNYLKQIKEKGQCWNCKVPNITQWKLRSTFEEEINRLESE
jgi:hypothetical protein